MDALTGLGGSSSESESELSKNGDDNVNDGGNGNLNDNEGAASLFAGYSDDGNGGSSDSDLETNVNENIKPSRKRRRVGGGGNDVVVTAGTNGKSLSSNNLEHSRNNNDSNSNSNSSSKLPSPQLLSPSINGSKGGPGGHQEGLYLCSKDYLKEHILSKTAAATAHETQESNSNNTTAKTDSQLKNKLDQMYNNFYSKRSPHDKKTSTKEATSSSSYSFARKLKSQKDFGNPYLFPSVVEHFGIEPMGSSCIPKEFWNAKVAQSSTMSAGGGKDDGDFAAFEFIERLIVKEEENRLRAHNGI